MNIIQECIIVSKEIDKANAGEKFYMIFIINNAKKKKSISKLSSK